jgi:hypothetical protein
MTVLYLYAVMDRTATLEPVGPGVGGELVTVRPVSGLTVAVGAVDGPPGCGEEALRRHDAVVRRLFAAGRDPLPLRFGQSVKDREALQVLVETGEPSLRRALDLIRGCAQMTLRVYGPPPATDVPLDTERETGAGTRHLRALASARQVPEFGSLRTRCAAFVRAERLQPSRRGPLRASLYHLVRRTDLPAWREAVAASPIEDARLTVTGPWPPYAFAEETPL